MRELLTDNERGFIEAWMKLLDKHDTTLTAEPYGRIRIGNSWFQFPGRFKRLKAGRTYTLKELGIGDEE